MNDNDVPAIRRAVIQQLEGLQRAGLTHWKRIAPLAVENADSSSSSVSSSPTSTPYPEAIARGEVSATTHSQAVPMPSASRSSSKLSVATPSGPTGAGACAAFQPMNLPRHEREEKLTLLAERVKACVRCQELAATRTQTVFGVGNPEARLMFIGEAPGADEDAQGEPFVGRAGQLLNDIIKACRMNREDVYICNVLRCRPPGNRLPSPEEAANCREHLDGQIALVNPDYIVCWGSTAAKNLLASEDSIGKMRGRFFQYGRAKVLCTYHPSYLLRNPAAKKDVWDDMKFLFHDMGIDLTKK